MKERASQLLQASPSNKEVTEAMKEVELRHEALTAKTKKNIEDLEWMTDNLTTHQDLSSAQAEWQKEMWEKLHSYTGLILQKLFCHYVKAVVNVTRYYYYVMY